MGLLRLRAAHETLSQSWPSSEGRSGRFSKKVCSTTVVRVFTFTARRMSRISISRAFDPDRYWRGPSWFNTAWLIAEALYERGHDNEARVLSRDMDEAALEHDFPEYLDPYSAEPRGTTRFSWTAALALDLGKRISEPVTPHRAPVSAR